MRVNFQNTKGVFIEVLASSFSCVLEFQVQNYEKSVTNATENLIASTLATEYNNLNK